MRNEGTSHLPLRSDETPKPVTTEKLLSHNNKNNNYLQKNIFDEYVVVRHLGFFKGSLLDAFFKAGRGLLMKEA